MEFIIEDNCYNREAVELLTPYLKPLIDSVLSGQNISSLDYFVIADSNEENYAQAVNKYASLVGTDTYITQDGSYFTAGKSLDGTDEDGKFHQAIVIKSSIWVYAAYEYLGAQGLLKEGILEKMNMPQFMCLALILHEIGHAIDNEHQYGMIGKVNTKVLYDLSHEYEEYVNQSALSLWGEYSAESFAYRIISNADEAIESKGTQLEQCIASYSIGMDRNSLLDRVYRILYFFVTLIACIHESSNYGKTFNFSKYEKDELLGSYLPILAKAEMAIVNLNSNYPHWESYSVLNELSDVFKDFVRFEYQRQKEGSAQN